MLKKFLFMICCSMTAHNVFAQDRSNAPAKETIAEWHGHSSEGQIGLRLSNNEKTATITFACQVINIPNWSVGTKAKPSEMGGTEYAGPEERLPIAVKVFAYYTRQGLHINVGEGADAEKWALEPGQGIEAPLCR